MRSFPTREQGIPTPKIPAPRDQGLRRKGRSIHAQWRDAQSDLPTKEASLNMSGSSTSEELYFCTGCRVKPGAGIDILGAAIVRCRDNFRTLRNVK